MWLQTLSKTQRMAFMGLAHNVIVSDGLLDPNEESMLVAFRREMGLSEIDGNDDDTGVDDGSEYVALEGIDETFDTSKSRIVTLLNLIHLSYADGAFEIEEECYLKELAVAFGLGEGQFLLLDNWVKRLVALEQEAMSFM